MCLLIHLHSISFVHYRLFIQLYPLFNFFTGKIMFKYLLLVVALLLPQIAFAQDTTNVMELVRTDLKLKKKAIIGENLNLTEAQSKIFWRIYNEYEYQLNKLGDKMIDNIEKFAQNFDNLSDDMAEEILDNSFDNNEEKLDLLKDVTKEIADKISYKVAVRFYQIEKLLTTMIDLQVLSSIPLIDSDDK